MPFSQPSVIEGLRGNRARAIPQAENYAGSHSKFCDRVAGCVGPREGMQAWLSSQALVSRIDLTPMSRTD